MNNLTETGLTTKEALQKLYTEISSALKQAKSTKTKKKKLWIKDALHHSSRHTSFNWVSASFQLWCALSMIIAYFLENTNKYIYLLEALIILVLIGLNLSIELYDNKLRHYEVINRIQSVLDKLVEEKKNNKIKWDIEHYPDLCSPVSPCITLQWTFRDGNLVNLPWALLVKDDVVLIRPGQSSPGYCEALDRNSSEFNLLHAKEIYAPSIQNANEICSAPKCRKSLENKKYKMLETPYLNNLRVYIEQALDRPITQINQQRHLIMIEIIERILLPITFFGILFVNLIRFLFDFGRNETIAMFFLVPTNAILPLLPLVFPFIWNLLNYLGMAHFKTVCDLSKINKLKNELLVEDDAENKQNENIQIKCDPWIIYMNFLTILQGKPNILLHSANILHVLGSVTALCCVDKKGILSWPNPTAEKVFFLRDNNSDDDDDDDGSSNDDNNSVNSSLGNMEDLNQENSDGNKNISQVEVLDLTHNHNDPFKLQFDDNEWQRYLTSLKPLGLAILLNTCNMSTQEKYMAFCSHIACEAIYSENLIPVTNRRCLCQLAKEIGFSENAQNIFELEHQLSTFRHLQPEMVRKDNKYVRSLHLSTKLKFPFPHMFAVIVKELATGANQLLSEGTADIILDSCMDYWNGYDLCPLTGIDRKRIQDFYQRSSLTANCTAFAYRPLNQRVNNKLNDVYLELPNDSTNISSYSKNHQTPIVEGRHYDCKSVLEPKMIKTQQFYSTDSLLYNDCSCVNISDAETCFHMQCSQVFIGMVTMQYQAITDMVQLIEQLERSCIRFVHFSKENELRSRVFSEKMGLESGWNCHISLLSERISKDDERKTILKEEARNNRSRRLSQSARKLTPIIDDIDKISLLSNSNLETLKTMSFSAPSAINTDHSIVKFNSIDYEEADERETINQSDQNGVYKNDDKLRNEVNTSHEWQSLSCLTDSTEQSVPINFDMSNRAKLPRGIDKIRPHIEQIDNVPLLVSLFTDCTPSVTREMLAIMQEYAEIVCILGSIANSENCSIFMQADASIAVEPLHPQKCQNHQHTQFLFPNNSYTPIDISRDLCSVACSITIKRDDPISFYHLIMEARHFVTILWSSVQFWLSCCITLSLMQFLATIMLLPDFFTTGQILYLVCFVIPLLSVSLLGQPINGDVMKKPQTKNHFLPSWNLIAFILWCYGFKFLPSVALVVVVTGGILANHCYKICEMMKDCQCEWYYLSNSWQWEENGWSLSLARVMIDFIVLLHFVVISVGFVYRDHLIYKRLPFRNFLWFGVCIVLIIIQSVYTVLSFSSLVNQFEQKDQFPIPNWIIILTTVSPIIVLFINELLKQQEINVNMRFRKRARLDFGTKLGMNSPF